MLIVKEDPVGIDKAIADYQKKLFDYVLKNVQFISQDGYDCYGRSYRNMKDGAYVPEVFTSAGDYKEVFLDDSLTLLSFFSVGENSTYKTGQYTCNVGIIFCANLSRICSDNDDRNDEELRTTIRIFAEKQLLGTMLQGVETGIANVFKEYDIKGIQFTDMHPFHCFRVNISMTYTSGC